MNVYVAPTQYGDETDGGKFTPEAFQGDQPACAVYSQYNVLKDYGYDGSPEDLIQEATINGWYDPASGTSAENIGKLLESHGVECDMFVDANKYNLIDALAHGKKVIVTVDSGELWYNDGALGHLKQEIKDFFQNLFGGGADHALVVAGINTADPDNVTVILTDSGSGQNAVEYPLAQFENAWADGHCTMVVPHDPPPQELCLDTMANFDYSLGHLASVGDVPYEEWKANPEHATSWNEAEFDSGELVIDSDPILCDPMADPFCTPDSFGEPSNPDFGADSTFDNSMPDSSLSDDGFSSGFSDEH